MTVWFQVTVPNGTPGPISLVPEGEGGQPIVLAQLNEIIHEANATLVRGVRYHYERADGVPEQPRERTVSTARQYDAVAQWLGPDTALARPGFLKSFYIGACHTCGVSYTKGNFLVPINETMDELKRLGANGVNFVPVWFVEPDHTGNSLRPIYAEEFAGQSGWVHATIRDGDLVSLITAAHDRGLQVYLVPHVAPENWGPGVPGKGSLAPTDPGVFFASYHSFINHYADIAEATGVELLGIGNELDSITDPTNGLSTGYDKTAAWREVARDVRTHYRGNITYSAACTSADSPCTPEHLEFWDALDVIGWEWYTPIAVGPHEPVAEMRARADAIIRDHIVPTSSRYGDKPVIITEMGWEAYSDSCAHTYGVGPAKGGDRIEQALCTEATLAALANAAVVQGVVPWTWTASLPGDDFPWVQTDTANEARFSIMQGEFEKWYTLVRS